MIGIIDYGMSNLRSVQRGFEAVGASVYVLDDPAALAPARGIVLPGDGAFGQTMKNLQDRGWVDALTEAIRRGVPFLGICLGMQLLFEFSNELGEHRGLGILPGRVKRFPRGKVPQIGWNQVQQVRSSGMLAGVRNSAYAYFVHSYYCDPEDVTVVTGQTDYGMEYASAVEKENVWAVQFHPEKSGQAGLLILRNFAGFVARQTA